MVDNDNRHCGMQAAFDAVEAHMLPGLGDAAEEAGPAVLLAAEFALVNLWVESGFSLDAFREVIDAVETPGRFSYRECGDRSRTISWLGYDRCVRVQPML
jgi:hypothetical protein